MRPPTPRQSLVTDLAERIVAVTRPHPVRVAIDGADASGKTTLADDLGPVIEALGRPVIRASIDGFHHPRAVRRRQGSLSAEGYFQDSFNYPALIEALLQPLGPGGSGRFRRAVFDFRTDEPVAAALEHASANSVLVFDGVFLLRAELRAHFDFSVFVRADFEVTSRRAEFRDVHLFGSVEEVRHRYQNRYIPGQQLYFRTAQPERWASVIVDNNDPTKPRIEAPV
jgi:uridine kinase